MDPARLVSGNNMSIMGRRYPGTRHGVYRIDASIDDRLAPASYGRNWCRRYQIMFGNQSVMWFVFPGESACDHECDCGDPVIDTALEKGRAATEMYFPAGVFLGEAVSI